MKIGIIGGSGLDNPELLSNYEEKDIDTPYGKPSSKIISGKLMDVDVCFLSRHGRKHEISPTNVNNRANIYALGKLGCTHIIATTACGSLKQEIERGDFVIVDQFIDFTKHRTSTFHDDFSKGAVHTPMADPFSKFLREKVIKACEELGIKHHRNGTVITIEGPRFSTRAESKVFRSWGADVINMSIAPECALANEAGIEYAAVAMSTDYDCWKTDEESVTWEAILKTFNSNAEKMKKLILASIGKISNHDEEFIKSKIQTLPNWPKPGVMFRDINSLLRDKEGFQKVMEVFERRYKDKQIDVIAGIESRGFVVASALAMKMGKPLVLLRKPGKLPFETASEEYSLEYGKDKIEIQKDAIKPGQKVLLMDDLIATAGTLIAACNLIKRLCGNIVECGVVIELPELGGRQKLESKGYPLFSIVEFKGE